MRLRAKIDRNQSQIVLGLRLLGYSVQSLATIGNGCPDLLVGAASRNFAFEVKDSKQPPSKRRLTPDELKWIESWRGQVAVVGTTEEILEIIQQSSCDDSY